MLAKQCIRKMTSQPRFLEPGQLSERLWSPSWHSKLLPQAGVPNLIQINLNRFLLKKHILFLPQPWFRPLEEKRYSPWLPSIIILDYSSRLSYSNLGLRPLLMVKSLLLWRLLAILVRFKSKGYLRALSRSRGVICLWSLCNSSPYKTIVFLTLGFDFKESNGIFRRLIC